MSSIIVIIASALVFILAYRIYATKIATIFGLDPDRCTPANSKFDGVDYVPAKNWWVFIWPSFFFDCRCWAPLSAQSLQTCIWGWGSRNVMDYFWIDFF